MKAKGWVRKGDKGPVISGVAGIFKLAVPDRKSGIGEDMAGHEVVVTGVVRDTAPDTENRGVVFLSCRHVPEECETCKKKVEEEKRREEERRYWKFYAEIVKKYNLSILESSRLPKAIEAMRDVKSLDDPRLSILSELADAYSAWLRVHSELSRREDKLSEMSHAPGLEEQYKEYCVLDRKRIELKWGIEAAEKKVDGLEKAIADFRSKEIIEGSSGKERFLREWAPETGGVETRQVREWDSMALPQSYSTDDEGPWVKWSSSYSPRDRGGWKWITVETGPAPEDWAASKAAEYAELQAQLEAAKAELEALRGSEEPKKIQAEMDRISSVLDPAWESYKESVLGDLHRRSDELWAKVEALIAKL